jgi:regulator of chromosome condensation
MAAAGSDNNIAITTDGKAYSWGFSANYQTGQGTDEDIEVATLIDNTAVRGKHLTWAGCGGQYSILAGPAEDVVMVNGEQETR